jgi:hypothetical protein
MFVRTPSPSLPRRFSPPPIRAAAISGDGSGLRPSVCSPYPTSVFRPHAMSYSMTHFPVCGPYLIAEVRRRIAARVHACVMSTGVEMYGLRIAVWRCGAEV